MAKPFAWEAHANNPFVSKPTYVLSPSGLTTGPFRRNGCVRGNSSLMRRNLTCSVEKALVSTSIILPKPRLISLAASTFSKSNGSPHTYAHREILGKLIFCTVMPFSHLRTISKWLWKLHGSLSTTHCNWLSSLKRNWNRAFPASTILRSIPNFQIDRKRFFAAFWLYGFSVSSLPIRLNEHYSNVLCRWACKIVMSISSSIVNEILWRCCRKSGSIPVSYMDDRGGRDVGGVGGEQRQEVMR